jgi:hypothetical protein
VLRAAARAVPHKAVTRTKLTGSDDGCERASRWTLGRRVACCGCADGRQSQPESESVTPVGGLPDPRKHVRLDGYLDTLVHPDLF